MAESHAGYFVREWQELSGQVRKRIAKDPRFDGTLTRRNSRNVGNQGIGIDAV